MLIAGVILLGLDFCLYRGNIFKVWKDSRDARDIVIFATLGMLAVQYTYFACIKYGNAAAATVLQYLMPVIIVGYTALLASRKSSA